jgi:hypothetical protein
MPSGGRLSRKQNHIIVEFFEEETGKVIEQLDVPRSKTGSGRKAGAL